VSTVADPGVEPLKVTAVSPSNPLCAVPNVTPLDDQSAVGCAGTPFHVVHASFCTDEPRDASPNRKYATGPFAMIWSRYVAVAPARVTGNPTKDPATTAAATPTQRHLPRTITSADHVSDVRHQAPAAESPPNRAFRSDTWPDDPAR
jgi:hypothetical protein